MWHNLEVGMLIAFAVIVVFGVILFVIAQMEPKRKEITTSQLMSTPEGRQQYAEMLRNRVGRDSKVVVDVCPSCEGYGRVSHGISRNLKDKLLWLNTYGDHCQDCGGTGIKGGLDYVVIDCPECEGTGIKDEVACRVCNGTKVVRREKGEIEKNAN